MLTHSAFFFLICIRFNSSLFVYKVGLDFILFFFFFFFFFFLNVLFKLSRAFIYSKATLNRFINNYFSCFGLLIRLP